MGCWAAVKASGWAFPTSLLSLYGFFANCRPAEPFLTPYLIGPYKNISEEVVTNYLFPIWTYSYLVILFPVFLLTDFLRYKPVIILQGLFLVTNYILLCFCPGLVAMTILQVNYAVVTASEVAYFSYIYSVIPVERYQLATGYLRSAMLVGYTFGATLGQVLVSLAGMSYFYINAITLGILSIAFLISLWLPAPQRSMFFQGQRTDTSPKVQEGRAVHDDPDLALKGTGEEDTKWCSRRNIGRAGRILWKSFREAYSSKHLIYWSLWWALATAGYGQVFNYIQLMWDHVEPSSTSSVYNGGVEAVCTFVGALAAFSVGHLKLSWDVWGELSLGLFSAVGTGAVFLMGLSTNIWLCYAGYITFKASYLLLITITTFQIASNLSMECYALTFGVNTFAALSLQTIITGVVVDETALGLDIVTQFVVYGSYYAAISVIFLIRGTYTACTHYSAENRESQQHKREPSVVKGVVFEFRGLAIHVVTVAMEALKRWRAGWGYPTTLLCVYGFTSTVKPLEPFLILYLTGPDKNLTIEQVTNDIFPVWTYSYLATLVPVFLLTDWLRYKPVIVFQCVNLLVTTALLLWAQGVAAMQAMQFFYGLVTASEVAYFSYIYSVVDLEQYRQATSYCRSVQLMGYTVGSVLGQLLVSFSLMSFCNVLVLTMVITSTALITSCFLPLPQRSIFFHRSLQGESVNQREVAPAETPGPKIQQSPSGAEGLQPQAEGPVQTWGGRQVLLQLGADLVQCYSTKQLLYWSVWWSLATCGFNQTVNYVQVLWEHIQPSQNATAYNGGAEAVSNLFGAATAYGIGFTRVDWAEWGELALGGFSALGASALFLMTFTRSVWVCYAGYIVFKGLYMLLITITMFQIAADLSMERYALVFGANNFVALVLQTILTSIVVDSRGLGLDIILQFIIYASYFSAIAALFFGRGLFTILKVRKRCKNEKTLCPERTDISPEQRSSPEGTDLSPEQRLSPERTDLSPEQRPCPEKTDISPEQRL
ncbi:uncharacterized protein FYW47_017084 [Aplochiton taeniatus]